MSELDAVAARDDPNALIALLDRVQAKGGSDELQANVIVAMRHHDTDAIAERLERVVNESGGPRSRRAVATALGRVGTSTGRRTLRQLEEKDPDERVRHLARMSLDQMRERS